MPKTTKTLTSAERGVNLFNDARRNSSNEYIRATGEVTVATSISHAMTPIVKYAPFMNEFLHYVVNKIVIQSVESKMYNNQYSMLKKEGFPLGTDMEMNYVNPAMGRDYDISLGATLLQVTKPDIKTCYFRQNRRRQFPVTIPRELMEGAFTSWEQLDSMVSGMVTSLYSGNEIEEENLIKKLIQTSVKNNVVVKSLSHGMRQTRRLLQLDSLRQFRKLRLISHMQAVILIIIRHMQKRRELRMQRPRSRGLHRIAYIFS